MGYKDKDKQREANKRAKERWKAKRADIAVREALGIPVEGIPVEGIPAQGIPSITQGSTKGITYKPRTVTPTPGTLNRQEIAVYVKALTAEQAQAILDGWADGQGTGYQQDLAKTGRAYGRA